MTAPDHPIPPELIQATQFDCSIQRCEQPATWLAQIHLVDNCDHPAYPRTPYGNTIHLYCQQHLRAVAQKLGEELKRRLGKLPNEISFYMCATCGRPINTLHDLLDTETL